MAQVELFCTLCMVSQTNIPASILLLSLPAILPDLVNTAVRATVNPFFVSLRCLAALCSSELVQMNLI